MLPNISFMDYFREIANSTKFQISAAVSFGWALYLIWASGADATKITITILFLFAVTMFVTSISEKLFFYFFNKHKIKKYWKNLTNEEREFISYYLKNETKTRYVSAYNGTWADSGIINPLVTKKILYLASNMSEFRGESWMGSVQKFPFNIHDDAYEFFKKQN